MEPIIDSDLSARRKARALRAAAPGADFLIRRVADDLADRLDAVERRFERAATLFGITGHGDLALLTSGKVDRVVHVDRRELLDAALLPPGVETKATAAETVPLAPGSIGLAVSLMALQDVNDIPGMLVQIRRALKADGLFLGALAGAGTLGELRSSLLAAETEISGGASPRVQPFLDVRDAGALLQRAGYALPVADLDTITVRYDTMFDLMRDLRAMGATSALTARSRRTATRRLFTRAAEMYAERFSDPDGRIRATFAIVWMSGWAPDASQSGPARRGSATMPLAEALKPLDD